MNATKPFSAASASWARPDRRQTFGLFLAIYSPLILLLAGGFYLAFGLNARQALSELKAQEAAQTGVAAGLLAHDFESVASDLRLLANAPAVRRYVESGNSTERARMEELFSTFSREKRLYDQVRFLDAGGMEVVRVNLVKGEAVVVPKRELQNKAGRYFFKDSIRLDRGEAFVSPMDLNIEHDRIELPYKPMVRFGTPVFDRAGERKGAVILNYFGRLMLDNLRRTMANGRQAMLLNRDGYWLASPRPEEEWGFMFGRRETFSSRYPDVWRAMSGDSRGSVLTAEGLYTYSTVYPLLASQRSSTGSPLPSGDSARELAGGDYFWKIVSFIPAADLPVASPFKHPWVSAVFAATALVLAFLIFHLSAATVLRRALYRKVRENETRLREVTDTLGEGVFVLDRHGVITFANPAAQRMLGYGEEALVGSNAHQLFHYQKPDGSPYPEAECLTNRTVAAGETFHGEEVLWNREGMPLPVGMISSPIVRDGEVAGSVVAIHDIRYLKEVEEKLRRLNENLSQQVKEEVAKNLEQEKLLIQQSRLAVMGEMIGNIAHQWRQPLNALGLLLANVKDAFDYGELDRQTLEGAVADGNRLIAKMSSTIDDFRNFFRPGRGKASFDLKAAVEDTVRLVEASYRSHNIEIRRGGVEGLRVKGHGNEFSQVLLNLLSNAKDAIVAARALQGRMEIGAAREGDFAVVTLADNGGGIPAEVLPRIFEPYYTTKETGTGIGLYMSKLIVDHMGGCMAADNTEDGAVFVLRLPLAAEE